VPFAVILACIFLLIAVCACLPTVPEIKHQETTQPENQTAPRVFIINATEPDNATMAAPTTVPAVDLSGAENAARMFASALQSYKAADMYPYLHKRLTDRYTPEQLQHAMLYFKPKDRMYTEFSRVQGLNAGTATNDSAYVALIRYGSDMAGWQMLELPLVVEGNAWKVVWSDNLSTDEGIVEMCTARLRDAADAAEVTQARKLSASSCIADIAIDLHDSKLCPFAFYDRERCLRVLNATLPLADKISGCRTTSPDNAALAKCLWDLVREEDSNAICRAIENNRIERYGCLGELGAMHQDPGACGEAINSYTMQFCLRTYIDIAKSAINVCKNATFAGLLDDCK
jgi:hypothetical protein